MTQLPASFNQGKPDMLYIDVLYIDGFFPNNDFTTLFLSFSFVTTRNFAVAILDLL